MVSTIDVHTLCIHGEAYIINKVGMCDIIIMKHNPV